MLTSGSPFDQAIVDEVRRELGITIVSETMGDGYFERLASEPPQIWSLGWVADYPGRNDFLGVLLATGATNNYGGWTSTAFDEAIGQAPRRPIRWRPGRPSTGPRRSSGTRSRSCRSRTGRAGRCHGPGCWVPVRTARDRPDGGPRDGQTDGRGCCVGSSWSSLTVGLFVSLAPPAAAATLGTFGTPTATSTFEKGVTFSQPVTVNEALDRVELLVTSADAIGPTVVSLPAPSTGSTTLTHVLDPAKDGHILPNTKMTAQWRLVSAADKTVVELGPEVKVTYADDRFDWKTEAGSLVRVHWYEGSDAFGKRALTIGEDAVKETSELLGVTESEPIDFYIYADQTAFYDALGPGTRENVGGEAIADDPNVVRAHPGRPDRRCLGRHRHPARADPPRLRHRGQEPVPLPAALAERGCGRLREPGLRRRATARRSRAALATGR